MRKDIQRYLLILLALLLTESSFGSTISVDEAKMEAISYVMSKSTSMRHAPTQQSVKLNYTIQKIGSVDAAAYLFQIGEDGGFVLVSADDNTETILGYADEGYFDATNIPENMQIWFQHYAEEISWASEKGTGLRNSNRASASPISPLLGNIVWNQDKPFWNQCPYDSDGHRSYTGCVATATAQIMRYWKHPEQGEGSHSYTWKKSNGTTQELSADFRSTTYDWNKMIQSYNGSYTNSQANAVATLMYHLGVATEMEYSSDGSGTQTEKAGQALYTYFGYDKSLYAVRPDYVGFSVFEDKMLQELQASRPVLMAGRTINDEGHAFVCDGYDGQYFHINWGWGGSQNGYFALSALDPEEQGLGGATSGEGFHVSILGIMGIRPDQGGDIRSAYLGTLGMRLLSENTIKKTDVVTIKVNQIRNSGISDYDGGYVGLAIIDQDNYFVSWLDAFWCDGLPVGTYYPNEFNLYGDLSDVTDDGEYRIVPVFTDSNVTKFWLMDVGYDSPQYFSFTKSGDIITFSGNGNTDPGVEYSITNLTASANGNTIDFSFESDAPYYHVKIYNSQETLVNTYIDFKNASLSDVPAGTWTIWVRAADANRNDAGEAMTTTVTVEDVDYNVYNLEASTEGNTIHFSFESSAPKFHVKVYNDTQTHAEGIIDFKNVAVSNVPDGEWTIWVRPCDEAEEYYIADAVSTNVTVHSNIKCTSVTLNKESIELKSGESFTLTATILPDNATNKTLTWSTSDTSIATVNQNGVVKGIKVGSATITAKTTDGSNLKATCNVTVAPTNVESVTLNQHQADVIVGSAITLSAIILPETATNKTVSWSSSDNTIATVTDGIVKGVSVGSVTISATAVDGSNKSDNCVVTVSPIKAQSITISPSTANISIDKTITLVAVILPENATCKDVTWSSSDTSIATVDQNGVVTGLSTGSVTITAKTTDGSNLNATCTVVVDGIPVESISLSQHLAEIEIGSTIILDASILPENATNKSVTWSSSNSAVATVTDGVVKGVSVGTVTIYATSTDGSDKYDNCVITVNPIYAESIIITPSSAKVNIDESVTLLATILPQNTTYQEIAWSSSDNSIAVVEDGIVKGIKAGDVTIFARTTDGTSLTAACSVEVNPMIATSITLDQTILNLNEGNMVTLSATVLPEKTTNKNVEWMSSDESVATVSNGVVVAQRMGQATIIAKTVDGSELSAMCMVNVNPILATSITLDKESVELIIGENITLNAIVLPDNTTFKDVVWSSDNEDVAYVVNGVVYALAEGTATITVRTTDGSNLSATCVVTVNPIRVTSIILNEESFYVEVGSTYQLFATVLPNDATYSKIDWISSDENVATVENGLVTGVNVGVSIITAKSTDGSDVMAQCVAMVQEVSGILGIHMMENVQGIYTLDGKKVEKINQGVYIIRMKDGSTKKFIKNK